MNPSRLPDDEHPIWERIADLAESLPEEAIAGLPVDGATQHDHYLYGVPKMTTESPNQLAVIAQQNGLATESATALIQSFSPLFAKAEALVQQAMMIEVTDPTQVTQIKQARAMRLELRTIRIAAENARKSLKEESLRRGKAVDGVANVIKFMIEPVEERLLEQEQIAERLEAFRKSELRACREEALRPLGVDTTLYQLGDMPEATYQSLLATSKAENEQRQKLAQEEEAKRVSAEAARVAEERRIRDENERLRKEAAEREKAQRLEREAMELAARKEREAMEAATRKEREAREKAEAELKAQQAAEAKKLADAEKAKKAAASAPDRQKIGALADRIIAIECDLPKVDSEEAKAATLYVKRRLGEIVKYLEQQARAL